MTNDAFSSDLPRSELIIHHTPEMVGYDVATVSAGNVHSIATKTDGSLLEWGGIPTGSFSRRTILVPTAVFNQTLTSTYTPETSSATSEIKVELDGVLLAFDQKPIIIEGRTLVPLRVIFEALGASVEWNNDSQTITAVRGDITIIMQIGNIIFTRNSEQITIDVPPQIINDFTMVPIRAVAESFSAEVSWEQSTQIVSISSRG